MKLSVLNELEQEINYLRESEELLKVVFKAFSYDLYNVEKFLKNSDLGLTDFEQILVKLENHFSEENFL